MNSNRDTNNEPDMNSPWSRGYHGQSIACAEEELANAERRQRLVNYLAAVINETVPHARDRWIHKLAIEWVEQERATCVAMVDAMEDALSATLEAHGGDPLYNNDTTDFPTKRCRNCGALNRPQFRGTCNDGHCDGP